MTGVQTCALPISWSQRGALLDKVSAVVILQEYLDDRRQAASGPTT